VLVSLPWDNCLAGANIGDFFDFAKLIRCFFHPIFLEGEKWAWENGFAAKY
jgi:hypothetical protein